MKYTQATIISFILFLFLTTQVDARTIDKDTVFHSERDINFKVYESGSSIVIQFNSENEQLVKLLEQLGLKIYFNEEGKKKEDIYINYPVGSRTEIGLDEDEQKKLQAKRKNQEIDLQMILKQIQDDAEYSYYEEERIFNILLNSLEVKGTIRLDDEEIIYYKLEVPKRLINPDNPGAVDAFKLGIKSGSVPIKQRRSTGNVSRRMGRGMGMRGRGRGRRRGRRQQMGGAQQNNTITINKSPVAIWFDVKLK